jgi:hypothetical protein
MRIGKVIIGFCEHGNEPQSVVKSGEVVEQFLSNDSALWNQRTFRYERSE